MGEARPYGQPIRKITLGNRPVPAGRLLSYGDRYGFSFFPNLEEQPQKTKHKQHLLSENVLTASCLT